MSDSTIIGPNQFNRTEMLVGLNGLELLKNAKVAVFGLGGVGSYVVEALARAGIGHIRIIDFDVVSITNINRQLPALHSTVGRQKTDLIVSRISDINPNCLVEPFTVFCSQENRLQLISGMDFVVDAIDSLGPKVGLLADCYRARVRVIGVMGAGNRLDPSAVKIADISKSDRCPLAKRVRKFLRRQGVSKGIPVVFSTETFAGELEEPAGGHEERLIEQGRERQPVGSISYMPGIMGLWAASYVIRYILGVNSDLQ